MLECGYVLDTNYDLVKDSRRMWIDCIHFQGASDKQLKAKILTAQRVFIVLCSIALGHYMPLGNLGATKVF